MHVLRAFNGDIHFIEDSLRDLSQKNYNRLKLEDSWLFFTQFPSASSFYQEHEIGFMLEAYMHTSGQVELNDLIETLNQL